MAGTSEQRLLDALATLSRAFAEGGAPSMPGADAAPEGGAADGALPPGGLDAETREVLGEAALAVAFGAFASRGDEHGPIQTLIASLGLLAVLADEEPDPPAEILGILAEDSRVESEIERAGAALDAEFGRNASAEAQIAALEARILGSAITLAGCTLPEGAEGPAAVRRHAARCLARLATGLLAMNAAGAGALPGSNPGGDPGVPPG
jgi:hypothetical protein